MALRLLAGSFLLGIAFFLSAATTHAADTQPDKLAQMIVKLLGNDDKDFRAAGLEQIRTAARGPELTKLFAAQLTKLDAGGQIALLNALADRGDTVARTAVIDLLASSHDDAVRAAAVEALGSLGGPNDLPLLIQTLSVQAAEQAAAARRSLIRISGETINHELAAQLQSASPAVRAALIQVLASRRARDESSALVAATVDDDAGVRRAAMSALGQIGRPEQISQMLAGVLKAQKGSERDEAEMNVAFVCGRIDDESQRGIALIEALNTVSVDERDQLLSLLGRVGGNKLIDFVAGIATGNDGSRRRLGIDALSKWPDASVADKLLEIANHAADSAERIQAFQGFVKVSASRDNRSDKQRLDRMKQAMQAARTPEEKTLVINRTRTAYDIDALRFVFPYVNQLAFAQIACETIVEIAHHREVRDPNKAEVDKMLDKVIETSKDPVVVDRANRYKRGETWVRPVKK